eukprot:s1573_g1.t1
MKTIVKTCDAGDSMQRFVTNSESFTLQLEGDRSLCLDWAARGGFERFETYPVVMRECNNTHSQRWLRVLKVAKLRTSFTDGEESCLSFDNINVEGGACSQAPVWNWRFSTNQLWTKFSDDIPELCLMRIEFVLSIQDVVLAPCDSTKLEQKFTILAERTIHLLEDDGRPGPYLCLDWDVENRYEKDSFRVITTTGALVGDTPDLLKPLSTSFEEIRSTITKELTADPAPDVSCEQIASTTEWLRSIIAAMTEHNSGFSRLGVSQLSDEELQRNQALARETSRQLTVLLAENTKQFRATPMGTVMAFGKGSQSQEVRQNLATFRQFWDKFGDEKWLSGLVAPEFAEKKELAKKLLDKLQGTDKVTLSDSGPICQYCSRNRGNAAFCQYPDCGRCSHGYRYTCQFGCGSSVFFCNRCGSGPRQQGAFCSSCNFCAHGRTKSNGCKKGCSDTQWQTQQTFCCFLHAGTEHGSFTVNVKAKNVTLYNSIAACSEATSKSKLMRLAQMADLLAKACREDAEAMEDAEQKLQTKMDRLKDFAEAINEVPKVLRKFLLIRSGSIKDDLGQLKEWLHKDEVDSTHMQLEEFRDEAAEERVMRRVGQKRALSEGSWLQPKGGAVEPSSTEPCRGTSACAWDTAEWSGCSNDCGDGTMVRSVSCSSGWDADCVEERPSSEMSCRVVAGCNWTISQWSVCDSSCGAGTQSRDASCTSGNAADCASPGPAVTQHCYETAGCSWQIGSWSSCSSGCGVGTRQRSVACSSGRDGDCPANERPTNSEVCYERGGCMWQMDDWGDCSSSCGLGLRTREVWCPSFIEADCEGSGTQPARSESCYGNIGCTWLSGDWSSCSNDCGTGFEVRPITCSSGRESDCLGEGRPLGNRTCFDSSNCAWLVGSWEPCNATCGEGWQARTVRCLGGDASLCPGEAPTALQSCRSQAGCQWLPGEWGPCSSTCEPGTRSRNISCSGTSEADCSQAPRPPDREPCNAQATGCDWNLGAWSPCSATACLALGSRVREVFCPSQHGDAGCPWPKPKALETCQSSRTCVWEISEWSECDATCGPGEKRRQVRCTSPDEEECPGDRPADREECYSTANCAWWTGTWTPCNATCGDGLQTRTLVCGADACDPTTAPSAVRSCRSTSQCSWQLGAWGGCSSRCGSGISERSVLCPSGDDVDCSAVPRPLDRRSCHDVTGCNWSTSSWSACSQTCGRGTSTRAVVCPSGDEGDCAGLPRPEAERSCSETVGCSWVLGQWSSCSSSCGNGTRSREVRCPSALSE